MLGDDVEHKRQCHARADAFKHAANQQHGENLRGHAAHNASDVEHHGKTKDLFGLKAAVQVSRRRDNRSKNKQVCGGEPLYRGGVHAKFAHEGGKRDVHGGFYAHA